MFANEPKVRKPLLHFAVVAACVFGLLFGVLGSSRASADSSSSPVGLELSRIGDALHLEFTGAKDWKYDLKKSGADKVTLALPALKPDAVAKLKAHTDHLVKSITVVESGIDGKSEITFTVTNVADFFDYMTDQPSRLIVDFFPKEATPKAKAAAPEFEDDEESAVVNPPKVLPAKKTAAKEKEKRKPAGGDFVMVAKADLPPAPSLAEQLSTRKDFMHGIFDGGDPEFSRFAIKDYEIKPEAIAESRTNFYLPFPMLDLGVPQLKALLLTPPTYDIIPTDSRENAEARVLLRLFKEEKPALLLKTASEFLHNYPESQYTEIVRYLVADTHYNIYRGENSQTDFEIAMNAYLQLSEKFPDSPITPRTLLLIGYSYLSRGDSFAALKAFQRFARTNPDSKHMDRVNLSTASAYLLLNRFDDTYNLFDQIEKHGKTQKGREEAAFRKGDVYFRKKDYPEAINQYRAAMKRFPEAAGTFPNALYNIAEAEFNLEKYREGLDSYGKFLQKFPDHEHGGYAMTRMGELLGILGADAKRAEGAFLESYFRYRATPGAGVARIRMLTSRMPSMREKELKAALEEVQAITKKYANRPVEKKKEEKKVDKKETKTADANARPEGEGKEGGHAEEKEAGIKFSKHPDDDATKKAPELPGIEEFSTLLIADGYNQRDEFDQASKLLVDYFQKNPVSPNKEKFVARIGENMTEAIRDAGEKGNFIEALRRYSRESQGWLKNSNRLDLPVYVGRAYEQAGVFKEAESIYGQTLKRLAERKPGADLPLHEATPSEESIRLRMAAVAAKGKNFSGAEAELKKIKNIARLSEPEQIEHAEVAADVAEARGQAASARKYLTELIKTWNGDPRLTASLHLRLAKILSKTKDFKEADEHLAKIVEFHANGDYMPPDVHAQALELRGDLFISRGQRAQGIKAYRDLLSEYEATRPMSSVRYQLGRILFEDGDLKGAEKEWAELKPERDNVWHRLAADQMQGAKWQNEYKKYLKRIPAAADMRASDEPGAAKR